MTKEAWLKSLIIAKNRANSNIKNAIGSHNQTLTINGEEMTVNIMITEEDINCYLKNPSSVA